MPYSDALVPVAKFGLESAKIDIEVMAEVFRQLTWYIVMRLFAAVESSNPPMLLVLFSNVVPA